MKFAAPGRIRSWSLCTAGLGLMLCLGGAASPPPSSGGTIGLVVTDVAYAFYQTADGKEECPAGLQASEIVQFKATPGYLAHMEHFGGTAMNRGPNGEMSGYSPLTITDPLPWKDLATTRSVGFNLDGTRDGRATAKTCRHDKFTDPAGAAVDNQMARVIGCVQGYRKSGSSQARYSKDVESSLYNRTLIEITGVDDEKNDPEVEIALYKSRDRLLRGASGEFVPYMSHRIDEQLPRFMARTRGRIVDGVLTADPIPLARLPMMTVRIVGERHLRDFSLRLKLDDNGAKGMMGGYEQLETWFNVLGKIPYSDLSRYSPALLYKAAHRYADGYPDAETGQCTAISTAFDISAVRALIVHPQQARQTVAVQQN